MSVPRRRGGFGRRRPALADALVWSGALEGGDVLGQDAPEVALTQDERVDAHISRHGGDVVSAGVLAEVVEEQRAEPAGEVAHQAADDLLAAAAPPVRRAA